MSRDNNIFKNGKKINYNQLRRGARTTDCHVFIHNNLLEDMTEMQVNYEDYYDTKLMKSKIINMSLMLLTDELSERDDKNKLKYLKEMVSEYKARYN